MLDTSALRDLHRAEILFHVFCLGYEVLTTDLIEQARELEPLNPAMLKQFGLKIEELPGDMMRQLAGLRSKYAGPGIEDLSALLLARHLGCPVVTRDGPLTYACYGENVAVRDTSWIIKKMVIATQLSRLEAADALEIINTTRLRTPKPEWTTQIRKWRKTSDA